MPNKHVKVLMLGWEYPPVISGGLGTACEGLTKSLSKFPVSIIFVMPSLSGQEKADHMQLYASDRDPNISEELSKVEFHRINSVLRPYLSDTEFNNYLKEIVSSSISAVQAKEILNKLTEGRKDIFAEVSRYAFQVLAKFSKFDFDIIHAHDWLTYPAAILLAEATKKPLVVHVHSIEFDRAGAGGNQRISEYEASGMYAASKVIAVSSYTKNMIAKNYHVDSSKIEVVHNGVTETTTTHHRAHSGQGKQVLFLGRVTFQKGPDYYIEAASKVLQVLPDVKFRVAGQGDMLTQLKKRVAELGIEGNIEFTGFLTREQVIEAFSRADLYIMPSVSEPFGISCLEAIAENTPVIVSRQSGVSEVISHSLKTDFWDVDKLADFVISALRYPELRQDMSDMSQQELLNVSWDASAKKVYEIYQRLT